ncbi:beta-lactamase family protein [Lysinibacillus fusiformis]|nr:beta-lactamase family protein [Lysinibacillus fusiformis]
MVLSYMDSLVVEGRIPGGVLIIQQQNKRIMTQSFGAYSAADLSTQKVTTYTLFDLASLTKIVATLPATLLLLSRREIKLTDTVQTFLPTFRFPTVEIQHLLQHSSGLAADLVPSVRRHHQRDVMKEVLSSDVIAQPGMQVLYSDLGMILLGKIIERVSGESLDYFVDREIAKPWGMHNTQYKLLKEQRMQAASTEMVDSKFVQGIVHDEKALLLQEVSGSAGLFSSAEDLATFAQYWLGISQQSVIPFDWMTLAYTKIMDNRGLGFEVWNGNDSSSCFGRRWTRGSFGHTGFTGTSIWMNPLKKAFVILLTNAVHYGRDRGFMEIREKIHTMIFEELIT